MDGKPAGMTANVPHGTIKFSDKIEKKMMIPITEISDSYPIDTIEYVLGERTVNFK